MNERINTQDLVDLLAARYSVSKKDAEVFIKEFFLVIEEGLEKDRVVKIKGFGTFKLIGIESRESINVNTGERFLIEGHTKISFTPDNSLRDVVNKPFSHFETVILNENTVLPDTPVETIQEDTELQDPVDPVREEPQPEISLVQEEIVPPQPGDSLPPEETIPLQPSEEVEVIVSSSVSVEETEVSETIEETLEVTFISEDEGSAEKVVEIIEIDTVESEESSILETSVPETVAETTQPVKEVVEDTEEAVPSMEDPEQPTEEVVEEKEVELCVEEDPEQPVASPEDVTQEKAPVAPPPSPSFASPASKRLTAEEIIALEIQKADEEHRKSLTLPFFSSAEDKDKEEKKEKEKKNPPRPRPEKKAKDSKLQRYLIAVVLLVILCCGGILSYYYMPEWFDWSSGKELYAVENPVQETDTAGPEDAGIIETPETEVGAEADAAQQVEESAPVAEVIREEPLVRETPVAQERSAAASQPTTVAAVATPTNPVPQDIASIPVRPDSVNYVIVGTRATHKIEEGETLTKVSYRF